jgi:hypothetical protein
MQRFLLHIKDLCDGPDLRPGRSRTLADIPGRPVAFGGVCRECAEKAEAEVYQAVERGKMG